jgi:RND family efflux transporter MFP subunit
MKKIVLVVVILLAGLFVWRIYRSITKTEGEPAGGGQKQSVIAVEVTPVRKGTVQDVKQFSGSLLPRLSFVVAPKVPGRLEKIFVNMGDRVKNGQMVAVLDSEEYVQSVEQARASLEVAKANVAESKSSMEVAEKEFGRMKVLREKKIASVSELDGAESKYKTSEARYRVSLAQVEQATAALKAAEVRLSYTQIRASWEGGSNSRVVGERYVDEGTMLRANDPIISVLDIDSLKAVIDITEEDFSRVHMGQSVVLSTDAYPDRRFTGKIVRISPELKENSRTAGVEVSIPNSDHLLKPGMFVRAEVELVRHSGVNIVPYSALTKREDKQGVFLLDKENMKVKFIPVETGITTTEMAEVIRPPIEGYVVTLGQHLLDDGTPVVLPEEKNRKSTVPKDKSLKEKASK